MNETYTEYLSRFSMGALKESAKLLSAIFDPSKNGLPKDFDREGIKLGHNLWSGNTFLTNDEYQVAMVDDEGNLYSFYNTPYEGREGSFEELMDEYGDMHPEDQEYMDELKSNYYQEAI